MSNVPVPATETPRLVLAADVGGTNARLGLYAVAPGLRPRRLATRTTATPVGDELLALASTFWHEVRPEPAAVLTAACIGVAGPVEGPVVMLTNTPCRVDSVALARTLAAPVTLLNDVAALAHALPALTAEEQTVLQAGTSVARGARVVVSVGTGFGQAVLHRGAGDDLVSCSEGGHADWAPRTSRDAALWHWLVARDGRAEVEAVVSGRGLVTLHTFTHQNGACRAGLAGGPVDGAAISAAALAQQCPHCAEALDLFVEALGAELGNVAVRAAATGGVWLTGSVARAIQPLLVTDRMRQAFIDKGAMTPLLRGIPVSMITLEDAGLLGAAVFAARAC